MRMKEFLEDLKDESLLFYLKESDVFEQFKKAVSKGKDVAQVLKLFVDDDSVKKANYCSWAEVSKKCEGHWYRVRHLLGNDIIKTYSDIGSIALCDDEMNFCSYIKNNYGDGTTRVKVFEEIESDLEYELEHMMCFITSIEGRFNLLDYDCAFENHDKNDIVYHFEGRYGVYVYDGMIALVKWSNLSEKDNN